MRVRIDWDDRQIRRNIKRLNQETVHGIALAFDVQAAQSTAYMKTNAPWTDRTSAARNGLHAVATHSKSRFELILSHAVSYGIWLEVKFSGRDAIILPSLRVAARELQNRLDHMWRRL
jgi:hypothetical protein